VNARFDIAQLTGGYSTMADNIGFGAQAPVPEPSTLALLATGADRPARLRLAETEVTRIDGLKS